MKIWIIVAMMQKQGIPCVLCHCNGGSVCMSDMDPFYLLVGTMKSETGKMTGWRLEA